LPLAQMSGLFGVPGGLDVSPSLSWSGAPPQTQSFTVTMYDPDAPSGSGFWHWALVDIPAEVTELPSAAGAASGVLPQGAFHIPNDARLAQFIGAGPPPGDGRHRYVIVVQALDIDHVDKIDVKADSTPALLGFYINSGGHLLARAVMTPWAEVPPK
jgi:Raf kinase inhibitor-like YbhB/YbcL family protein